MPRQKITTSLIENTECILLSCHKVINFDFWSDLATSPPFWVDLPSREKRSDLTSAPKLPCMSEDWSSGRGRRVHATWPHGDHQGKGTQTERGREGKRERERERGSLKHSGCTTWNGVLYDVRPKCAAHLMSSIPAGFQSYPRSVTSLPEPKEYLRN